jgi:hypothetical protein
MGRDELARTAVPGECLLPLPETRIIGGDEYHMQNIATFCGPHWPESGGVGASS